MAAALKSQIERRNLLLSACILAIAVLHSSVNVMALTSLTARTRRLFSTALQDGRSSFTRRPHPSLIDSDGIIHQPKLSKEEFQIGLQNQLILAPLTRGGNLPFRRLCTDFQSNFTMSEMAYARTLFKGYHKAQKKERALAKKGPTEKYFGFQIATKSSDEALRAAELAVIEGASWIDLNCGCPIYEATRRGLGAAMLKRPGSLEKLVGLTVSSTTLPMTVKIRLGVSDTKINAHQVVEGLVNAGVAAVTVHGRTMEQRYTRPADWNIISDIARTAGVPIIGNGDILTWFEAEDRMQDSNNGVPNHFDAVSGRRSGVTALMAGRGALIKPWIFKEWAEKKSWFPTAEERIAMYWQLAVYFKEHFGADEFGKRHSFYFLPWHFEFFCRYRPLPDETFREISRSIPLIQNSRSIDDALISIGMLSGRGEPMESRNKPLDSLLERLLRCEVSECHLAISEILWASESAEDAVNSLMIMAHSRIVEFEQQQNQGYASTQAVRGKGVQRNNGEGDSERGRGRSDESSWEMGGSGPRGTKSAPVEEGEEGEGEGEGEGDEVEGDDGDIEESAIEGDGAVESSRPVRSKEVVRSNSQGRTGGRGSSGISPSEMMLPFVELRVGKVMSVGPHPDPAALNLMVMSVDLGSAAGGQRIAVTAQALVTGNITGTDSIVGTKVVALCNIKERSFLGVTSSIMVLFSTNQTAVSCPLYAPEDAPLGSIVTFPGYASKPSDSLTKAAKAWRQLEKDCSFYVNDEGIACFDPRPLSQREKLNSIQIEGGEVNRPPGIPFSIYMEDPLGEKIGTDESASASAGASARTARRYSCSSTVIGKII